MLATG